ncbi:hypothetical protein DFJ73DRAFT_959949 [Zopfochytrium polystomum]|nr:hypothetical protein DFJ73DRAFT_959949 [Zopfochytrium polystomum]
MPSPLAMSSIAGEEAGGGASWGERLRKGGRSELRRRFLVGRSTRYVSCHIPFRATARIAVANQAILCVDGNQLPEVDFGVTPTQRFSAHVPSVWLGSSLGFRRSRKQPARTVDKVPSKIRENRSLRGPFCLRLERKHVIFLVKPAHQRAKGLAHPKQRYAGGGARRPQKQRRPLVEATMLTQLKGLAHPRKGHTQELAAAAERRGPERLG